MFKNAILRRCLKRSSVFSGTIGNVIAKKHVHGSHAGIRQQLLHALGRFDEPCGRGQFVQGLPSGSVQLGVMQENDSVQAAVVVHGLDRPHIAAGRVIRVIYPLRNRIVMRSH